MLDVLVAARQCAEMVGLNNLSGLIELLALVHAYLMKNQHGICMYVAVVVVGRFVLYYYVL